MNYFELYDMPVSFQPDQAQVKAKFYELSRKYHPDRYANADAAAKIESLKMSALNNEAYKALGDPDKTMGYILKLNGLLATDEKYSLPPAFLMEMMEINEAINEFDMQPGIDSNQTKREFEAQLDAWKAAAYKLTAQYEAGDHSEALLLQIKDYYFRKKYLLRIQERIDKFATH